MPFILIFIHKKNKSIMVSSFIRKKISILYIMHTISLLYFRIRKIWVVYIICIYTTFKALFFLQYVKGEFLKINYLNWKRGEYTLEIYHLKTKASIKIIFDMTPEISENILCFGCRYVFYIVIKFASVYLNFFVFLNLISTSTTIFLRRKNTIQDI